LTPEQSEFLELVERILNHASADRVYKHIRVDLHGHSIFIEDTVTSVLVSTMTHGAILDLERSSDENSVVQWKKFAAEEMTSILQEHYILDLLAGL